MYLPNLSEYREASSGLRSNLTKYGEALKRKPKVGGMRKRFTTGLKVMIEDAAWFKRTLDKMDKLGIPVSVVSKYIDFDDFLNDLKIRDSEWEKGREDDGPDEEGRVLYIGRRGYSLSNAA